MASAISEPPVRPAVDVVADACFLASHRLTEWVSNAPTMEEDVALANIALDLLGQARGLYSFLGDEDQLAYFRDAPDWRNPVICELPNGDFAHTMVRQLFLDLWLQRVWPALATAEEVVRGVAAKARKENAYHLRHSAAWVIRLGDGTEESHQRMLAAIGELWPYCSDLQVDGWYDALADILTAATLPIPAPFPRCDGDTPPAAGVARSNREHEHEDGNGGGGGHTPHLEALLAESQSLARAHPGATW